MTARLWPALLLVAFCALAVGSASSGGMAREIHVDDLIGSCPSAAEVAEIKGDFQLRFEGDLTSGNLVCTAAAGSADLTLLQERTYQALRVAKALSFARPLPWTSQGLYDWLVGAIDGIRFRNDITNSFCCDPPNFINVKTTNSAMWRGWIGDPQSGPGLDALLALFVHEARHNEGKPYIPHTCGTEDATFSELGAWGVQVALEFWEGLFSGSFLDAPGSDRSRYRAKAVQNGELFLRRICTLPSSDLSLSLRASPNPVRSGSRLSYSIRVANAGPEAAPQALVQVEAPLGTRIESSSAAQGACTGPTLDEDGPLGCDLGALMPGASTAVEVVLNIAAPASSMLAAPAGAPWLAHVTGPVRDGTPGNNSASPTTAVIAPISCVGKPSRGGVKLVGTDAAARLVGTPGRDVLCGGNGADRLDGRGGADILRGGAGADTLLGGPGDDLLDSGPGRDLVLAGAGRDRILARDGARDTIWCGSDRDIATIDRVDLVHRSCEQIRRR